MGPIYRNVFKSCCLPSIHVFAWRIPSSLHLISMLCPALALCHGHPSSVAPVHLLMLLSSSNVSIISVIVSVLGFCPSRPFFPVSLFLLKIFPVPCIQWLLMFLLHQFQLLLPPLWPGRPTVAVSCLTTSASPALVSSSLKSEISLS